LTPPPSRIQNPGKYTGADLTDSEPDQYSGDVVMYSNMCVCVCVCVCDATGPRLAWYRVAYDTACCVSRCGVHSAASQIKQALVNSSLHRSTEPQRFFVSARDSATQATSDTHTRVHCYRNGIRSHNFGKKPAVDHRSFDSTEHVEWNCRA